LSARELPGLNAQEATLLAVGGGAGAVTFTLAVQSHAECAEFSALPVTVYLPGARPEVSSCTVAPVPTICPPFDCHVYVSGNPEGSFTDAVMFGRSPATTVERSAAHAIVGAGGAGFGCTVTFAEQLVATPLPLSTRAVIA
jgi:hypothetical protein